MSPLFPGMDPYLEAPAIWPDFHEAFLSYMREALQPVLPERYYAQLGTREEVGIAGYPSDLVVYPDVAVKSRGEGGRAGVDRSSAAGRAATAPERLEIALEEPFTVSYLEIRERPMGGKLVTLIELLSPSNKLPGPDREAFERKQAEIFASEAHWIEIDLLRAGKRLGGHPRVDLHCRAKGYDYVVVLSRSSLRSPSLKLDVYGFTVRDSLPVVAVPLLLPDPDVPLDLGRVLERAYETGPYRKVVRYDLPPDPPLSEASSAWARSVLGAQDGPRRR